MKKNLLAFAIVTALSIYSSVSLAACSSVDLAGTWQLYSGGGSDAIRCIFTVPTTTSPTIMGTSCLTTDGSTFTISGKLTVGKDCHVTGQISSSGSSDSRTFDGWISKGKDSMSGMSWKPASSDEGKDGELFSAVKQ